MTKPNLFEAFEICLQSMEQGADLESCLVLFPELAKELRPILSAAMQARSITAATVPLDVVRRGRARLLQTAAEMREQKKVVGVLPNFPGKSWRRNGFFGVRFARLAVSFVAVTAFLATGGTGLVNASTGAIPGDKLYPVKRSWEGVRLIFVFDKHAKEQLAQEFDHERVQEIEELYSVKRIAEVNFVGVVQEKNDKIWVIDGLNISIENETRFAGDILPGAVVQVIGETDDGHIKAQQIMLLATPGVIPGASSSSTATFTRMPEPSATQDTGEGETGGWFSSTPGATDRTTEPTEIQGTSTSRPGDDSEPSSKGFTATPTPTGGHADGESEHHATQAPTESEHSATPRPTEGH